MCTENDLTCKCHTGLRMHLESMIQHTYGPHMGPFAQCRIKYLSLLSRAANVKIINCRHAACVAGSLLGCEVHSGSNVSGCRRRLGIV